LCKKPQTLMSNLEETGVPLLFPRNLDCTNCRSKCHRPQFMLSFCVDLLRAFDTTSVIIIFTERVCKVKIVHEKQFRRKYFNIPRN
jgi:hypothetical protein